MTGATGHMGYETLRMLLESDSFVIRLLALPDKEGHRKLKPYYRCPNVTIIWGDLTNYADVLAGAAGADIILHLGAVIPPASDYHPELARRVNYQGTLNVIAAAKARPDKDCPKLVFIGTVAEAGSRLPPVHWGRVGDPIQVSRFDAYSESKVMAERAVIESGLPGWVSLRQTAMLYPELFSKLDPIMFHHPLNTHMEWVTVGDSARVLVNLCRKQAEGSLPDNFWCRIYNIGGGESFRKTNEEFMQAGFRSMGIRDFHRTVNPNWFAAGNFHGCWFLDSDKLNHILDFRRDTFDGFFKEMEALMPLKKRFLRLAAALAPAWVIKLAVMRPLAMAPEGTLHALKLQLIERCQAFWPNIESWKHIPSRWKQILIDHNPPSSVVLHGFDENKPEEKITLEDLQAAAAFRGGSCLAASMTTGDLSQPLLWRCGSGHTFPATPRLVLHGGHWCPICDIQTSEYAKSSRINPFLRQVLSPSSAPVNARNLVHNVRP